MNHPEIPDGWIRVGRVLSVDIGPNLNGNVTQNSGLVSLFGVLLRFRRFGSAKRCFVTILNQKATALTYAFIISVVANKDN